jgi:hypothetical protein
LDVLRQLDLDALTNGMEWNHPLRVISEDLPQAAIKCEIAKRTTRLLREPSLPMIAVQML